MARSRLRSITIATLVLPASLLVAAPGNAATPHPGPTGLLPHSLPAHNPNARDSGGGEEAQELLQRDLDYGAVRTAPGATVSSDAFAQARASAAALPAASARWSELTTKPYQSDASNYRDPFWSNSGGGSGLVSGRMSALAVDGSRIYAGAADGGVWRSTDRGAHWTPVFDSQPNLAVGAIAGCLASLAYSGRASAAAGIATRWGFVLLVASAVGFLAPAISGDTVGILFSAHLDVLSVPVLSFVGVSLLSLVVSAPVWVLLRRHASRERIPSAIRADD